MKSVKCIILGFLIAGALFISCFNPFFPATGGPFFSFAKPEDVITELRNSYESQELDRFDSLFYDIDSFRFFIGINSDINLKNISKTINVINLDTHFLPKGSYLFLNYSDEKKIHNNLFSNSESIKFLGGLFCRVEYLIPDTVTDPSRFDTTEAIIYTNNAQIEIKSTVLLKEFTSEEQVFTIKEQRFLVKKNKSRQWKIFYWYEPNLS